MENIKQNSPQFLNMVHSVSCQYGVAVRILGTDLWGIHSFCDKCSLFQELQISKVLYPSLDFKPVYRSVSEWSVYDVGDSCYD